ncbi:MAG: hypothetical protein EBT05_10805, partial [Betaproteobacteria bacterium]|nr:hypothetical protein [Betaproteobacteria bacterium]
MAYEQEHPLIKGTSNDTTAATPDRLGSGWLTASLASSADVDYFKIDTTSAALIKIDLSNLLVTDTKHWSLALLDGNGDYLRSLTSTVSGAPLVDGASNTGTSLKVTGLTADVPVGSRFSFVTSAADSAIYTVSSATPISAGGSTLTLTTALPSSLAASTALAFDPAQTLVGGSTTSFTGQVSAAGTYFAKVVANSWIETDYNIRATVLKTIESTGENGSKDEAIASATSDQNRPVENAYMTGALSDANDHDFWVFSTATMTGSLTLDFSAASGSNTSPKWDIKLTQWTGDQPLTNVQGTAISGTAGASRSFTIDFAKYTTATTFVVDVSKASGVTVDTGAYKLRLSGATLDLNDSPLVTIDGVTSSQPYDQKNTGVTRSVKAGADSKVALSTLYTATDADAGQTVANFKVALSKATGETANLGASIQLIESNGTTSTTFALGSTASLTAAQMAKAYVVPGSVTGNLSLALQAFDSSGALDNSGASSVMVQTLRVVSSSVGVTATNDGTLALEEGRASSTEVLGFSLGAAPTADVKVYLEQDASKTPFVFSSSVLTFTTSNYATVQNVTVTARNNQTTEGAHTGQISFRVVSTDSQYDGYALTSFVVAISDPTNSLPTGVPTLGGTPTEDQTLSAVTSGVADLDVLGKFNYNWQRSTDGTSWTDIGLATTASYLLGDADAGKKVRLEVSYVDGQGTKETVYSAPATIANVNDAPTGSVTISGTASTGQTLTASNTLADADGMGTVSYQWRADDANIANSTGSTLLLGATHAGKSISVAASYTDLQGTAEQVLSGSSSAVADGKTVDVLAYSWKAHTLLDGVTVGAGSVSQVSSAAGTASFAAVMGTSLSLTASRAIPSAEATATSAAVNLQDAIAILKMIVGLEVNGT